jgi:hypothetical protein
VNKKYNLISSFCFKINKNTNKKNVLVFKAKYTGSALPNFANKREAICEKKESILIPVGVMCHYPVVLHRENLANEMTNRSGK